MRIVDWNIEHMNHWFVPGSDSRSPSLRQSYKGRRNGTSIDDVPALARRAAGVLNALDPDLICIQEGAGANEVSLFLERYLPLPGSENEWRVFGGAGGAQKLIVAARLDRSIDSMTEADDSGLNTQLRARYEADIDGDSILEPNAKFARVPQIVEVKARGRTVRIINCHLKSKYVDQGKKLWTGSDADRQNFIRAALVNRRRISAEAFRIRTYLDELLSLDPHRLLLLTGDLNDGPGFDYFERRYLTHSVVDSVFGSVLTPEGRLVHPLIQRGKARPASAHFDDFVEGIMSKPLLLDHFGLSPALANWRFKARVADAEFDAQARLGAKQKRERLVSDHRPILVELEPRS